MPFPVMLGTQVENVEESVLNSRRIIPVKVERGLHGWFEDSSPPGIASFCFPSLGNSPPTEGISQQSSSGRENFLLWFSIPYSWLGFCIAQG